MNLKELIYEVIDKNVDKYLEKIDKKGRLRVDTRQIKETLEKEEGYIYAYGYLYGKKEAESFIGRRVRRLFINKNRVTAAMFPYKDMSHVEQLPFEKVKEAYRITKTKYRDDFRKDNIKSTIFYALPDMVGNVRISDAYINEYGDVIAMGRYGLYVLKQRLDGGYPTCDMPRKSIGANDYVKFRTHTLVAMTFTNNPFTYIGKPMVHHIDGKKTNNYYKNLEYVKNHVIHRGVHHQIECIQASPRIGEDGKRIWMRWEEESLNKRLLMPAYVYGVSVEYIYDMLSGEPDKIDKENPNIRYYKRKVPNVNGKRVLVELRVTWKK